MALGPTQETACLVVRTGEKLKLPPANLLPLNPENDFNNVSSEQLNNNMNEIIYTDPLPINTDPQSTEENIDLINFALDNTVRKSDGRLQIPLFWNGAIKHQLSQNYRLAFSMLNTNLKKLRNTKNGLQQINDVFLEQEREGIIERIDDLPGYLKTHPNCAFLAHMPIIREDAKSTKVRLVFLPTQREKLNNSKEVFSNNQCIKSGPNLNHKIITAVNNLRFGRYLLTYDLRKAFLSIELPEEDRNKLLFLWFKDVDRGNFEPVAFKNNRVPFGIKCSPAILSIALYKILIDDAHDDPLDLQQFKRHLFHHLYVDNGCVLSDSKQGLKEAKIKCQNIFNPYCFSLQQFITNINDFQIEIDKSNPEEPTPQINKLLGVHWDRLNDTLGPKLIKLDPNAFTKRQVLQTLNSIYDILGLYLPIVNKAKQFMQRLSLIKNLNWDDTLPINLVREWRYICKYINTLGSMAITRNVGSKNDEYHLVCFTDASKMCYGIVVYIINITQNTSHFLFSANHFNSAKLKQKTIPELEMRGVAYGSNKLIETYKQFTGSLAVEPINITKLMLYNDSLNTLQRINTSLYQFEKLKGPSVFVKNAIQKISQNSDIFPIQFGFVSGETNPADHVTRILKYDKLLKTNFLTGPPWLLNDTDDLRYKFIVPHPLVKPLDLLPEFSGKTNEVDTLTPFIPPEVNPEICKDNFATSDFAVEEVKPQYDSIAMISQIDIRDKNHFSNTHFIYESISCVTTITDNSWNQTMDSLFNKYSIFRKPVSVMRYALKFINNLKLKVKSANPNLLQSTKILEPTHNFYSYALAKVLQIEQIKYYPDVYKYLLNSNIPKRDIPDFVLRYNPILMDGLVRIKAKTRCKNDDDKRRLPILLPKNSNICKLLIEKIHDKSGHNGIYFVLNKLHETYFLETQFSVVSKLLKNCVDCKRYDGRTIKLNQNSYREFRSDPSKIPFRSLFLDHMGPFKIYSDNNKKHKEPIYILIFTCLWSRAVNLKLCAKIDTDCFIRAFQEHVLDYGICEICLSDLGSSIVAGTNVIKDYLSEPDVHKYLTENNIQTPTFSQYAKGNSELGSLVECCVKMIKNFINKVLKK